MRKGDITLKDFLISLTFLIVLVLFAIMFILSGLKLLGLPVSIFDARYILGVFAIIVGVSMLISIHFALSGKKDEGEQ